MRFMLKRALQFFSATGMLLLALGVVSKPAGAIEQPGITVKPNQTVEVTHPAPLGAGNVYPLFGNGPADCKDGNAAIYCDTIPLKLDVPNINKGFYSLTLTLSWNATNLVIPGTGTAPDTALGLGLWDDPINPKDTPPAPT